MAAELKNPELSRNTAAAFAEKWKNFAEEKQHARGFWSDFFRTLCGVDDEEIAGIEYERRVKSSISGNQEYIDVYWKNVAIIEHKSAGENLDKAELQARGYWLSLPPGYRPKTIIICDFQNFRIIDVALNRTHEFPLSKLPENIHRFEAIISGNRSRITDEEITVDQEAARLMANLYLELESHGFEGHETSVFLIRILFLLFGDDTGMWKKKTFLKLVANTKEDGSDVGPILSALFEALNTPLDKRIKTLDLDFDAFPYVNGGIFEEKIAVIDFSKKMRGALIEVANYDWTTINPTIFGSLFQLIKNKEDRRELGEHYTSEENINKIVYPLFLDALQERLASAWDNKKELKQLRQDLAKLKFFDPACGCGNFLVVSYRHLRQLELELIVRLNNLEGLEASMQLDGSMGLSVNLNQFFGIEIEEWPAQVARMALFLTDHQENLRLERITGATPNKFPIRDSATIVNGNALELNWESVLKIDSNTYLLGNPPFIGTRMQSLEQKANQASVWGGLKGSALVDFVGNWFVLAARHVQRNGCEFAFVSTNSITQGDQPSVLWQMLNQYDVEISFAHRTFAWNNESSGQAAVHCVILGVAKKGEYKQKKLWTYETPRSAPIEQVCKNINAYLIDGSNVLISSRRKPLRLETPLMISGNKPRDGGFLSDISLQEAEEIRRADPIAAKYLRELIGADELLNKRGSRFCLWLVDASPNDLKNSKVLKERVAKVLEERKAATSSKGAAANRPALFETITQPETSYFALPSVSSEKRKYIPISILSKDEILNNALFSISSSDLSLFAILQSRPFTVWVQTVSSRMKSDYQISSTSVYNTFPFPKLTPSQKSDLTALAEEVLSIRDNYMDVALGDLYDPIFMPLELQKVHSKMDSAVMKVFGMNTAASDADILGVLFNLYAQISQETLI
jgi:type I restriction-modification system DNA methylase subunit